MGTAGPLPGLREDAPGRAARSRGSRPVFRDEEDRQDAVAALMKDVYAQSSQKPEATKLEMVLAMLADWKLEPWPPDTPHA